MSGSRRWSAGGKGPVKASGLNMVKALDRVSQITGTGFERLDLESAVPARRLTDLARYGMTASATQIRRHPSSRRLATLLSTVVYLESKAIDDALELLDLLMATELLGKAERDSDKDKVRRHPRLARASAKLAAAVEVLFEVTEYGERDHAGAAVGGHRGGDLPPRAARRRGSGHRHGAASGR